VKIIYAEITPKVFKAKMDSYKKNLDQLFSESKSLENEIKKQIESLNT
jgi:type I restriction enzyme M protein